MSGSLKEKAMQLVFLLAACASIIAVILICVFMFGNGIPAMQKIGFVEFLTGTEWKPLNDIYGILPMIIGSIYVTAGAIIIGVPIGILCATYMAKFCPPKLYKIMKPAVDLLAGIPSIVYGFFGLVVIVPIMQDMFGGSGKGVLTASVMLGIMILPTIISVSESSIRAVPESYYEGSLALGATHERSIAGCIDDRRKSADHPGQSDQRRQNHDDEYRIGNGIRYRTAPRGADRYSGSAVCIHTDYQPAVFHY